MPIDNSTIHPPAIANHICRLCREDIACGVDAEGRRSELDAEGHPTTCKGCSWNPWNVDALRRILSGHPKRRRSRSASAPRKNHTFGEKRGE
jgi:hypothetical protein